MWRIQNPLEIRPQILLLKTAHLLGMESLFSGLLVVKCQRTKKKEKRIHLHLREEMGVTGVFFGVRTMLSPLENVYCRGDLFWSS